MIGALILIGATILNMRARAGAPNSPRGAKKEWKETIVPAPADDDPIEMDEARHLFEGVFDKHAIVESDMPAYWKLMKWARSLSFAELEERARRDVPFTKLWEEPDKHRGELIRLRLHVRRVVEWDGAPKNPAGVKTTYDVSGVTDESKTNPYVVVCFELPPEIPVEADTYAEAVFVGYFLKILAYQGGDEKNRGAPLLIGRMKAVTGGKSLAEARTEGILAMVAIGVAIVLAALVAVALWRLARGKRRGALTSAAVPTLPNADIEAWLENPTDEVAAAQPSHAAPSTNGSSHLDG
jgi:hypothetical protein